MRSNDAASQSSDTRHTNKLSYPATFFARYRDIAYHKEIHVGAHEAIERLCWRADHGLVLIKERVEHHRNSCELAEALNEAPVARVGLSRDRLQTARAVVVGDGGNSRALAFSDLEHLHHEVNSVIFLEPIADRFLEHRWREWPERFPPLDLGVEFRVSTRASSGTSC